jgi:hypothetical protein
MPFFVVRSVIASSACGSALVRFGGENYEDVFGELPALLESKNWLPDNCIARLVWCPAAL